MGPEFVAMARVREVRPPGTCMVRETVGPAFRQRFQVRKSFLRALDAATFSLLYDDEYIGVVSHHIKEDYRTRLFERRFQLGDGTHGFSVHCNDNIAVT